MIYPGVYAKSLLLRSKNATNIFVNRRIRRVRLPGDGRSSSSTRTEPVTQDSTAQRTEPVKANGARAGGGARPGHRMPKEVTCSPTSCDGCSGAVVLLIVLSMVTFAIFYLVPRLGGATPETLAARYVGRAATAETVHLTAERLGLLRPGTRAVLALAQGHLRRRRLRLRRRRGALPGALPRLLLHHPAAGVARAARPRPGHHLARRRGGADLAGRRRQHRRDLGPAARDGLRPGRHGHRAGRGLAADLLHRPDRAGFLQLPACGSPRPAARYIPFIENPAQWAYYLLLPWITLAFLFSAQYARLTRAGMLETMSEDYIRTARAKGLPERTRHPQARAARGADPDPHDLRPRRRPAARRCGAHREDVLAQRSRQVRLSTASSTTTCRRSSASPWSPASS